MTNDTRTPSVAELEARLDEAKWWFYDHTLLECHCQWHQRIADLESQLAEAKARPTAPAETMTKSDHQRCADEGHKLIKTTCMCGIKIQLYPPPGLEGLRERMKQNMYADGTGDGAKLSYSYKGQLDQILAQAREQAPADEPDTSLLHFENSERLRKLREEAAPQPVPMPADREEMARELATRIAVGVSTDKPVMQISRTILDLMQAKGWLR